MRRLFILLSIILACCTVAFAAEFSDFDQISNQEDVLMLSDLDIFSGYEDGTFRPLNTITREEMAKVIAIMATTDVSVSDGHSFTDTEDSWASEYIEYCVQRGIISGSSDLFRPEDKVTGYELSKMLLVLLRHDETQFTGSDWKSKVEEIGENEGLFQGYSGNLAQYVSRDNAALLLNNALQCCVVSSYGDDGSITYVTDNLYNPINYLLYRYGIMLATGVVEANNVYDLRTETEEMDENTIYVTGYTKYFLVSEDVANDISLLGHSVRIYATFDNDVNTVYGVPSADPLEIALPLKTVDDLMQLSDLNIAKITSNTKIFEDYSPIGYDKLQLKSGLEVELTSIDHTGDGQVEYIFVSNKNQEP